MSISFMGLSSVVDRTLFTNKGPVVKKPLPVLTGLNLHIVSNTDVYIPTASFSVAVIGFDIIITGSAGFRNDGKFRITQVVSPTRLRLANVNFDTADIALTTTQVVTLANDLKTQYNRHRISPGIHGTNDTMNAVSSPMAVDLYSAIVLLNEIRSVFGSHLTDPMGVPPVHKILDVVNTPVALPAKNLISAVLLANDLRAHFENHRTLNSLHLVADFTDVVYTPEVKVVTGVFPGPLTGPFIWTIYDPREGIVADTAADVSVRVNGNPASVDAVFGLLGAVVLTVKPGPTDSVFIDYSFITNPPSRLLRLNSPEFGLNQVGNRSFAGMPGHTYRSHSYLINPGQEVPDLASPYQPQRIGWKYKGLERVYSTVLNDPNTLLLNVPTNRLTYPVLLQTVQEVTVRYDPTSLPQNSSDPWTLEGDGVFSLAPGGGELTIIDSNSSTGPENLPPFFTHKFDFLAPSVVSTAFRARVESWSLDGVFTGVSFGVSDGNHVALAGFIESNATGLSSAITLINSAKANFNSHVIQSGVHNPDDPLDQIIIVDAKDLPSLIILANEVKLKFNSHVIKNGIGVGVHQFSDVANSVFASDATDLPTAILLANSISASFNTHRVQPSVHFQDDLVNIIPKVKQIGILTSRGAPESEGSWNAFSTDWNILRTYRIALNPDGDVSIYLSGSATPIISVGDGELPAISDLDGRFDPIQQIFFGSIEKEAKSDSRWDFIRANINPLDSNLVGDNKSVDYEGTVIPERDSTAPWITVGQGGVERVISSDILLLDSTCSAPINNVPSLGQSSGAYRGFLRLEPVLTGKTSCAFDFRGSLDYYTFGVDNRACCVLLDDDNFSIVVSFLQFSPSPATVSGTTTEPFSLVGGSVPDTLVLSVGANGLPFTVIFGTGDSLITVISKINSASGFTFADNSLGHLRLTSSNFGAAAQFSIISGTALAKLGLSPGVYFGLDSNPEPRVSWFGENFPNLDTPHWIPSGTQTSDLLGRILRLSDRSVTDYRAYTLSDPLVTNQSFNPSVDWKLDIRVAILSFISGVFVPASAPYLPLSFAGALVSVDEGMTGKNLELHLSFDSGNNQYLNLLSFNSSTSALDVKAQYAFNWNDGQQHSFNVYTNKGANTILVLADGIVLTPLMGQPALTYTGLNSGVASGPSLSFGSGGEPVTGCDLRATQSIAEWHSVSIFRDSKIANPSSASNRFIGIFKGGNPAFLSSYYLHQVDWGTLHTYRVIRDPVDGVSVYVDNGAIPVISTNYDSLTLPPSSSSFLKIITDDRSSVAFGSFNPQEISRSRWEFVRYSMGKITITNRVIPPHQVLNQANVMVSPDHLFTTASHTHQAFKVYSGGTPTDDFMSDSSVAAYTILGEGTPTIPATQNLETRGGLEKQITPFSSILTTDFVDTSGFLSDYEDDISNVITAPIPDSFVNSVASLVALVNSAKSSYNVHLTALGVHLSNDVTNPVVLANATDLASSILLVNSLKLKFNTHRSQAGVHQPNDPSNIISLADATDLPSAVALANQVKSKFDLHHKEGLYHVTNDAANVLTRGVAIDLFTAISLADEIRLKFPVHASTASPIHNKKDPGSANFVGGITGVGEGFVQGTLVSQAFSKSFLTLSPGDWIMFLVGPNASVPVSVSNIVSNTSISLSPAIALATDLTGNVFAKLQTQVLASGSATVLGDLFTLANTTIPLLPGNVIQFTGGLNVGRRATVVSQISPTSALLATPMTNVDPVGGTFNVIGISGPPVPVIDTSSLFALINTIKSYFNSHLSSPQVHPTTDVLDLITSPNSTNLATLITLVNEIRTKYGVHLSGYYVHLIVDSNPDITTADVTDALTMAIVLANEIKARFNLHVVRPKTHVKDDEADYVLIQDATNLSSLLTLLNEEKRVFNIHRTQDGVHVSNDTFNTVASPNATDLPSALTLLIELAAKYSNHLIHSGVHGSSVFIRLVPPSRVLYEGMKFFEFSTGESGHVASFSDEVEGVMHDTISNTDTKIVIIH